MPLPAPSCPFLPLPASIVNMFLSDFVTPKTQPSCPALPIKLGVGAPSAYKKNKKRGFQ